MTLFIANLRFFTNEEDLRAWFNEAGHFPSRVKIIVHKETGQSRGFGFVDFDLKEYGDHAIRDMDQRGLQGRKIGVREAEPRKAQK